MQIRAAQQKDASAIARVHVRAWQSAYRGIMPDDYLDGLDASERAEQWRDVMNDLSAQSVLCVAEQAGEIIGFAGGGPALHTDDGDVNELYALNVDPDHFGRGVGDALLQAFLSWSAERSAARPESKRVETSEYVCLWVATQNARARRFYERRGFSWDGSIEQADVLGAHVEQCRYVRSSQRRRLHTVTGDLVITTASDSSDWQGILALQRANLVAQLTPEVAKRDGFVTVVHDLAMLEQMHRLAPSVVARAGSRVVAYALTMPLAARALVPILAPMFQMLDTLAYRGTPLPRLRYYVMGQICVAEPFRGQGVFQALYAHHCARFAGQFDLIVTEVSARNARSLRAHERAGFELLTRYCDATDEWVVLALDLRRGSTV